MINRVKSFIKILAATTVAMSVSMTVSALEAEISGAGNGKFLLTGNIGKFQENRNVTVMVYKPEMTANDITIENPLSALYYIGETKADNAGNFEYLIDAKGELDSYSEYRVVVCDYTRTEQSLYAVAKPLAISADMAAFGHNYFDADSAELDIKITDAVAMTQEAAVTLKIYERGKNTLLSEKTYEGISLDESGNATVTHTVDFNQLGMKYGTFTAELTVSADGREDATIVTSFANIRKAEELNKKIGTQHHYGNSFVKSGQENVVKLFADAGYGMARDDLNWSAYEKTDDSFALYEPLANYIDEAEKNGIKMLLISSVTNKTVVDGNIVDTEADLAEYGEYIYKMVYDTVDKVSTYEIMNEINHFENTPDRKMTAEEYFNAVKIASVQAKAAAEQKSKDDGKEYKAEICAGALAYVTYDGGDMLTWVEDLFKLGIGEYIDKFSHHIYTQTKSPEASVKQDIADEVRAIINKYGYTQLPIVLSEIGYSSTSEYENPEHRQAVYEIRDLALLYDKYNEIYFYCGVNKQDDDSEYERELGHLSTWYDDKYNSSGVAYSAKPVFAAMANFNALLANAELDTATSNIWTGNYDYKFINADGKSVNMIWNSWDTDRTYTLSDAPENVLVYDMYGNATAMQSESGEYTLSIGAAPVYVVDNTKPLYIADADGAEISVLADKIYIKGCTAYSEELGAYKVLAVLYNENNQLYSCEWVEYSKLLSDGGMEISASGAEKLNIFIWDDFGNIKPIIEKIEILKEEQ